MTAPILNHPALDSLKARFPTMRLRGTEFRRQTSLVVEAEDLHTVMAFLRDDAACQFNFLSDVTAVDYLDYPAPMPGRFAVVYLLQSYAHGFRLTVKVYLDPSLDTTGNDDDPSLIVDSVTDLWAGAEWPEREVYDMFGIRFANHPDLRRILLWRDYPGFPLRKDYPLRGRGERETYAVTRREDA